MATKPQRIDSIEELRRLVPVLVKRANDDQAFALRAANNPLLALEEAGVTLSSELRAQVERLARFSPKDVREAEELSNKIFALAKQPFDLDDGEAVNRYRPVAAKKSGAMKTGAEKTGAKKPQDASYEYDRLVAEYRKLSSRAKPLASRESYELLKSGKIRTPIKKLTFVLKKAKKGPG